MRQNLLRLGDNLTVALVIVYFVLAAVYALSGLHNKALYWFGAGILTFAVLRMA